MMKRSPTIWLLGDGKPGHENQALGLSEAMARRQPCQIHRISLVGHSGPSRFKAALRASASLPPPDFIIGVGHATHIVLLYLAWKFRAKSIVLMRPSLPMSWFTLCIAPHHDFKKAPPQSNVLLTHGVLNRVNSPSDTLRKGTLILIGGPSKTHGWDETSLLEQLTEISKIGKMRLTNSRRTPAEFAQRVQQSGLDIDFFPHEKTTPDWLARELAAAGEVWVTEDSVSMVYEALTSGARVGLLEMPRLVKTSRVLRGVEKLRNEGYLTPFAEWQKTRQLIVPPAIFREADRCAAAITIMFD